MHLCIDPIRPIICMLITPKVLYLEPIVKDKKVVKCVTTRKIIVKAWLADVTQVLIFPNTIFCHMPEANVPLCRLYLPVSKIITYNFQIFTRWE